SRPEAGGAVVDMTALRTNLRLFFVGGFISYRALFNWMRPAVYIPTMLIGPVFQILFFTYLGRYSRLQNDNFFMIGNAVQGFGMSVLLLHFRLPVAAIPAFALIVVVSVASCTAFGLTIGSLGMRARDVFMFANVAYYVMWLLCGVNIPLDDLPGWLAQIGRL